MGCERAGEKVYQNGQNRATITINILHLQIYILTTILHNCHLTNNRPQKSI